MLVFDLDLIYLIRLFYCFIILSTGFESYQCVKWCFGKDTRLFLFYFMTKSGDLCTTEGLYILYGGCLSHIFPWNHIKWTQTKVFSLQLYEIITFINV